MCFSLAIIKIGDQFKKSCSIKNTQIKILKAFSFLTEVLADLDLKKLLVKYLHRVSF